MSNSKKFIQGIKKYPLSISLSIILDYFLATLSVFPSTLRLKFILSSYGCRYGRNLKADGVIIIRVRKKGAIELGNNVSLLSRFSSNLVGLTNPMILSCLGKGQISIGDNTGCSSTVISSISSIRIGSNTKIGANVRIFDYDFHSLNYLERREPDDWKKSNSKPVLIGNDVFIGTNAIILKGVTIGDRSIIGAGAVVTKSEIPADSLVVGNPGKVLRISEEKMTGNNIMESFDK